MCQEGRGQVWTAGMKLAGSGRAVERKSSVASLSTSDVGKPRLHPAVRGPTTGGLGRLVAASQDTTEAAIPLRPAVEAGRERKRLIIENQQFAGKQGRLGSGHAQFGDLSKMISVDQEPDR